MGYGHWSPADWARISAASRTMPRSALFAGDRIHPGLDPRNVSFREARDSRDSPESTPIVLALDETGSMGEIAHYMATDGLGTTVEGIIERKPVTDPQVMVMGIGDADCDRAPLQVGQFEADLRVLDDLRRIWLEGGGGGNAHESYTLPWWFCAFRVRADRIEKRRRKGVLITIGDEMPPPALTARQVRHACGGGLQEDISTADLLKVVSRTWDVFHVIVEEGSYASGNLDSVTRAWRGLLGQRALGLGDKTRLAEVIVSAIEVNAGRDPAAVARSWNDPGTALAVAKAVGQGLVEARGAGLVRFS